MKSFRRTPWMGIRPIARPLPTAIHPCLEGGSNPRSYCSRGQRPYRLQTVRTLVQANDLVKLINYENTPLTAFFSGPNIIHSTLFSKTLKVFSNVT